MASSSSRSSSATSSSASSQGDVPVCDAPPEEPAVSAIKLNARNDYMKYWENDNQPEYQKEGLVTLWNPRDDDDETSYANTSSTEPAIVADFDIVVVHGIYGARQPPWKNPGSGDSSWLHDGVYGNGRKVMSFGFDAAKILASSNPQEKVGAMASQLLHELLAGRHGAIAKRSIMFVAHDIGGIIVKQALVIAGLSSQSYGEIFDFTRVLLFYDCPHRASDALEMQERLSRLVYYTHPLSDLILPSRFLYLRQLANTVVEINNLFLDSKHIFRSYVINIYTVGVNKVLNSFTGTLGVPFEVRIGIRPGEDKSRVMVEKHLSRVGSQIVARGNTLVECERRFISIAAPVPTLLTAGDPSPPFDWISGNEIYKTWYTQRNPGLLYLRGSRQDEVRRASEYIFFDLDKLRQDENGQVVLYYTYEEATSTNPRTFACNRFDRNDIRRNKMVDMLSVLLAQILGHIPSVTGSSLTYISRRFIKDRSWTIHDLLHAFEHWRLESEIKAVSCVINNFDQCEQVSRKVFLDLFSCLSKTQERPWRVLVASSEPETLSDQLSQWPVLDMDVTRPDSGELDDIDRISVKTQCSSPTVLEQRPDLYFCQSLLNDELKTLATLEPQTRDLVLQYVCGNQDWPTRQTLSDILGPIKAMTIDTVLERILDNVADPGFAFTALSWILYSMRPPTFWELATVLLVRLKPDGEQCLITSPEFVNEVVTKVKRWLGGIVVVDQHEFHLSTANIRNILLKWPKAIGGKSQLWHGHSEMILAQTAHAQLAMICLDHLSQTAARRTTNIPSVSSSNNLIDSMACGDRTKLCDYATRYWVHHFSCASASPKTQASLQMFMQSAALSPWSVAYWKLANPFTRSEGPFKSIYPILAGLGVPEKVETWQQGDKDISAAVVEAYLNGFPEAARGLLPRIRHATKSLQHALIAAGSVGEELAWRELIEHIAASYPEFPWSTLQVSRAAWWGFDKIISRLLDLGCPVGEQLPEKSTDHTTNASKSGKIVAEDLETDIEENISTEQVLGPIWAATRTGQSKAVKVLVQHGANILRRDPDGYTLLAIAAVYGHSQVLPLLVRAGAFVDEPDPRYLTSLYSACLYGLPECARILLELGANPDLKVVEDQSQEGWCPLAGAADGGYVECVRVLLHGKANPNVTGHRGTPLRYAVCDGSVEICRLLLENGADPNHSSIEPPILHLATGIREHKKKIEVLKVLVEAQANIDALDVHKSTALHWACLSKDPDDIELITYLLDHGASVNAEDRYGRTPLHYVTETGLLDVVRLLLDRGADPNAHLPGEYTPLMPAIQGNHIGIVRMLVQHGADVDPPVENDRWGPTEYAAKYGHAEVLKVLADSGADVNRRFGRARCPLVQLALDGSALGALLEFRPALDVMDEDGDFPLHSLRSDTPLENVKLLVRAGSDLNLTDRSGCTYLSLSLIRGCKEIVEYLICKNADVNPLSPRYGGALHIACGKRMVDMVKRLVEKGAKVNAAVTGLLGTPLQSIILKEGEPQVSGSKAEDDAVISIIEYLLDSGADINTPGGMLGSVTNAAAWQASGRVLKYLLSNEARVVVSDGMGRQPVHLATLRGLDHFNIILDADADIRPRDKAGRTILHWAAQGGHLAVLERVLQLTGDDTVNEIDIDGWTPLCWAARGCGSGYEPGPDGGQATIVKELIRRGANIYVKSQIAGKEWTPASIAEYHGCSREVIKLLTLPSDAKEGESSKGDGDVSLTSSNILPKGKRLRAWPDAFCDMCLFQAGGIYYACTSTTCEQISFGLCYKCYNSRNVFHSPGHAWEKQDDEFVDVTAQASPAPPTSTSESISEEEESESEDQDNDDDSD